MEVAITFRGFGAIGAEFDAHDPAHAPLLHCHPVQHVRRRNGAFTVGDNDELRVREKFFELLYVALDVGVIQRRVQLVQHTERAGLDLIQREQQGNGRHGLFAAG